ncbi:hypothetical protein [Arenimonas oryziterrae]|uniref:Lipoprotein n=1 Tax=Arenimonas oryziterrae DSM 21050 = YC6267 TaxID=1121015 RepID=A0A091AXL0_9GAMM|nr:hypothetical protein [Arenimonas oryziterrae]KFN45053.1 hypothetical protein N789_03260 [Arenimonas oryziterrae DSM 21050 = YC6267]
MNPRFAAILLTTAALALAACQPDKPAEEPAKPTEPTVGTTDASVIPAANAAATSEPLRLDKVATPKDTLDTLRARFGADNVVAGKVPGAEGEEFDGWILYPTDESKRVYIYLDDKGQPEVLRILDQTSTWQRSDGIRMDLDLNELAKRNGKPIEFSGFGWDYGGNITSWGDGAMDKQLVDGGFGLCPPEFENDEWPKGYPEGEGTFSSTLPIVQQFPPVVCTFAVIVGENAP